MNKMANYFAQYCFLAELVVFLTVSLAHSETEAQDDAITHKKPGQETSKGEILKNIKNRLLTANSVKYAKPEVINATFGKVYPGTVDDDKVSTFIFYGDRSNLSAAVRVHVTADHSSVSFPVLFVVKEQQSILSWQVPLLIQHLYKYLNVSRTLCPAEEKISTYNTEIAIDVSSMSEQSVSFTLMAEQVNIDISTNQLMNEVISPSEPKYFRFKFPKEVNSIVIRAESDDDICMTLSVQDIHCPVFDLVRNVEFTGHHQTVTKKGAMNIQRSDLTSDTFYVVLVAKPNDYDCNGIVTLIPKGSSESRRKQVQLVIRDSISEDQYLTAVLVAMGWFLLFYAIALIVSIVYGCRGAATEREPGLDENEESDNLIGGVPDASIRGADGAQPSYGTLSSPSDGPLISPGMFSPVDAVGQNNGIPHRIPPPHEDDRSLSSIDEDDIDMLQDIDQEKDVFRTKTFLYVSDLARKPRKALSKKYTIYTWNLVSLAIFYGLPVIQLVITYQKVLHVTGNQDICYYNFYCSHPLGVLSAFNNVFSNIGYIMLGLLFLILVGRRNMMYSRLIHRNDVHTKNHGIPQHFGLFYAMGIALMMEGILSGCYHVCPSYSNFQFDTSFMYMIGWLCMLKIYQTRHPDINAHAHVAYFAIAFVVFMGVIGVVYSSTAFWICFVVIYLLGFLMLSIHVYYMGCWRLDFGVFRRIYLLCRADRLHCIRPMYTDRMILLVVGNIVNWGLAIFGLITQPRDFSSFLVSIFIINLLMYFAFYVIMKLRNGEKILPQPLFYIIIATITWALAFYFFVAKLTSWEMTPAISREGNKDCILLNFYDEHDIWHFLSSMSLFFGFMILLTLDDDLINTPRNRIPVF